MAGSGPLNAHNIISVLDALDKELAYDRARAEIYIAGGARMLFGMRSNRTTSDIDGIFRKGHGTLTKAIKKVGKRLDLPANWLNEQMTQSLPMRKDNNEVTLYHGKRLTVRGASPKHMLAMKVYAARDVDMGDIRVLAKRLKIEDTSEMARITKHVYEGSAACNDADITEKLDRISDSIPELKRNHRSPTTRLDPANQEARKTTGHGDQTQTRAIPERPSAKHRTVGKSATPKPTKDGRSR